MEQKFVTNELVLLSYFDGTVEEVKFLKTSEPEFPDFATVEDKTGQVYNVYIERLSKT